MRRRYSFLTSTKLVQIHRIGWISIAGLFAMGFVTHWLAFQNTQNFVRGMEMSGLILMGFMVIVDIVWIYAKQ